MLSSMDVHRVSSQYTSILMHIPVHCDGKGDFPVAIARLCDVLPQGSHLWGSLLHTPICHIVSGLVVYG